MPAHRFSRPQVRLLTRRAGIEGRPVDPDEPLLEIAELFRLDVVAEAFEMPDFEGFVRVEITQGEDWRLPSPIWAPATPEPESEPEEPEDPTSQVDWCLALYQIVFSRSEGAALRGAEELAESTNWRRWWSANGLRDGHQDLFSRQGLLALRAKYRDLPEPLQDIVFDTWRFISGSDYTQELQLFCLAGEPGKCMIYFAENVIGTGQGQVPN